MYSLKYTKNKKQVEKKTAKGITRNVTENVSTHQDYKDCLFEQKLKIASMNQIRSEAHQIYSIKLNKIGLSPYDDKRYIMSDGMYTLAHGHYTITQQSDCKFLECMFLAGEDYVNIVIIMLYY